MSGCVRTAPSERSEERCRPLRSRRLSPGPLAMSEAATGAEALRVATGTPSAQVRHPFVLQVGQRCPERLERKTPAVDRSHKRCTSDCEACRPSVGVSKPNPCSSRTPTGRPLRSHVLNGCYLACHDCGRVGAGIRVGVCCSRSHRGRNRSPQGVLVLGLPHPRTAVLAGSAHCRNRLWCV